jgi:hypothetical protein
MSFLDIFEDVIDMSFGVKNSIDVKFIHDLFLSVVVVLCLFAVNNAELYKSYYEKG